MAEKKPKGIFERIFSSVIWLTLILLSFSYFEGVFCFRPVFLWASFLGIQSAELFFAIMLITCIIFALILSKIYIWLLNNGKNYAWAIIVVLLFISLMPLLGASCGGELSRTLIQSAFVQGCHTLAVQYNCDPEKMSEVNTLYVYGKSALNLSEICKQYLNDPSVDPERCVKYCYECPNNTYSQN